MSNLTILYRFIDTHEISRIVVQPRYLLHGEEIGQILRGKWRCAIVTMLQAALSPEWRNRQAQGI